MPEKKHQQKRTHLFDLKDGEKNLSVADLSRKPNPKTSSIDPDLGLIYFCAVSHSLSGCQLVETGYLA